MTVNGAAFMPRITVLQEVSTRIPSFSKSRFFNIQADCRKASAHFGNFIIKIRHYVVKYFESTQMVHSQKEMLPMKPATATDYVPALRYRWLTRWYDALMARAFPEAEVRDTLIDSADIRPGQQILDFGTGTASLAIRLKQRHPLPEVVGVDVDPEALAIAQQKVEKAGVYLELAQYNGETLPYPDATFDRIVTCLVLHHLDPAQKRRSLRELRRVLKPSGSLHVADWGKPSNRRMRLAFYVVQLLDGFKTTRENVQGRLPQIFHESGFALVQEAGKVDTLFGTMRIYSIFGTKHW